MQSVFEHSTPSDAINNFTTTKYLRVYRIPSMSKLAKNTSEWKSGVSPRIDASNVDKRSACRSCRPTETVTPNRKRMGLHVMYERPERETDPVARKGGYTTFGSRNPIYTSEKDDSVTVDSDADYVRYFTAQFLTYLRGRPLPL